MEMGESERWNKNGVIITDLTWHTWDNINLLEILKEEFIASSGNTSTIRPALTSPPGALNVFFYFLLCLPACCLFGFVKTSGRFCLQSLAMETVAYLLLLTCHPLMPLYLIHNPSLHLELSKNPYRVDTLIDIFGEWMVNGALFCMPCARTDGIVVGFHCAQQSQLHRTE